MQNTEEEILDRKITSIFPNKEDQIRQLLSEYGKEDYERGSNRVKLAILKLSGGSIEKVKEYVQDAKKDYRDVLAWAEYPEQMRTDAWKLSPEENKRIQERDIEQYEAWLNE